MKMKMKVVCHCFHPPVRKMIRFVGLLLILGLMGVPTACVTPSGGGAVPVVAPKAPDQPLVFRSNDYVVHQLTGVETPETLAEQYLGDAGKAWMVTEANSGAVFQKGQMAIVPLQPENRGGLMAEGLRVVPVLCYHWFRDECTSKMCMPSAQFEAQMKYLKDNGFQTLSFDDFIEVMHLRQGLPPKPIIITIDDGYQSGYSIAYPIMKKYGFTATYFIYTDFVGVSKNAVSWDQLRELKSQGFTIASHSVSHADLTQKKKGESTKAYTARIRDELVRSKEILDEQLQQNTQVMAWPFGKANAAVEQLTAEVGYDLGITVKRGGNSFFAKPFALHRDQVLTRDLEKFSRRLVTFKPIALQGAGDE